MIILLILSFASIFNLSNGCQMEGISSWLSPIGIEIKDIHDGDVFRRTVSNIAGVHSSSYGEATLGGSYFDINIVDNQFVIATNDEYRRYEHNEVSSSMDLSVEFNCVGGGQESLLFIIQVQDTNNNEPEFLPSDTYNFVISPPLPPHHVITGCGHEIIVRDIDLTTYKIHFGIEENEYFEIEYDEDGSTTDKEFKAILRTTSLIRNLREPLELRISATDADFTGDDPNTTYGTLRVTASSDFDFPDDLLFSQTFYMANYTADHQLNLVETVELKQGYDADVKFRLETDGYDNNFEVIPTGNQLTIVVRDPLHLELMSEKQIYLIVKAEREYTSGATATIIIQLPDVTPLRFENPLYYGKIENKTLDVPQLQLNQGNEIINVTAEVVGEYSSYFSVTVEEELVTLTMNDLPDHIIENNSFISLQVEASSIVGKSTAIVSLDIIKDDNVTPVFDKSIYTGTYDPVSGLTVEQIEFVQGFDDTVVIQLFGEHQELFTINRGRIVTVNASEIPEQMFGEHSIVLWIEADKARTVGANAAIIIALPTVTAENTTLVFEKNSYIGSITNNDTDIPTIVLIEGYSNNVRFSLEGDLYNYFRINWEQEVVTVSLPEPIPENLVPENNIIVLNIRAYSIIPEITPVYTTLVIDYAAQEKEFIAAFDKVLFEGELQNDVVNHESITLSDFTGTEVEIFGEHRELFEARLDNDIVTVTKRDLVSLPANVTHVVLELVAGTARAVLILNVLNTEPPAGPEASFDKILFEGDLRNGILSHETITLTGYNGETVGLIGEYNTLFETQLVNEIVTVTGRESPIILPPDLTHLALELVAGSARAVLLLNIHSTESPTTPEVSFNKVLFEGTIQNGVVNHETITLTGFTGTNVELFGEFYSLFDANLANNVVTITGKESPITLPSEFAHITLELVAGSARAVLVLRVHNTEGPIVPDASFNKVVFDGILQDGVVTHETITLSGYTSTNVNLFGEFNLLFEAQLTNNIVTVTAGDTGSIPANVTHVVLELVAGTARAVLVLNVHNTEPPAEPEASFDKILFEGDIRNGILSHETITLTGYNGETVGLIGDYNTLFETQLVNDIVTVTGRESPIILPPDLTHLALELVAGSARAVLLLNVHSTESPTIPEVSFNKVLFEGTIQNGVVNHETITLTGFTGTNVELFGEFYSLFDANLANNVVTITGKESPITLPSEFAHITLELVAGSARAVLVLRVHNTEGPIVPDASFNKVIFDGILQDGVVTHETITLSGYTSTNVNLFGEFNLLFEAQLTNNIVTVTAGDTGSIPANVTHVVLELVAGTARAVLVLNVHNTEPPAGPEASFDKILFEGDLRNGILSHETITLTGYNGETVGLIGEYNTLFETQLVNEIVTVTGRESPIILPPDLTHLALELVAGSARAVLLLNIHSTESPTIPEVSFNKVLFEGTIQNGVVNHETITLTGFTGTNVELFGGFYSLFDAHLANNVVTITGKESPITLPSEFAHITLELVAGSARAVLVLSVHNTEGPIVPDESFNKVLFDGILQDGVVTHETITLSGYTGTNVNLFGEFNLLFEARLTNNIVTVTAGDTGSIPANVTHVVLELVAGTARAVLVLNVHNTEPPTEPEASFDKILFEGDIRNGILSHETITLTGYNGETVGLIGEYNTLFETHLVNEIVTVTGRESPIILPPDLTHLALELVAGSARAVLLLNIHSTESPTAPEVSFNKVLFEGTMQNGVVNHETITLTGFTGTNVELFGEFYSLFDANLANNVVTITGKESPITLPSEFAHITLELVAGSARAVLVLSVHNMEGPIVPDASFNKVVFDGILQDGIVTHETITLSGYTGTNVNLFGEFNLLFEARLTNNIVTVTAGDTGSIPANVTHVVLELVAGTARAVLVLDVHNTEPPAEPEASFDKILFEGDIRNGILSHETITLTGYNGETVGLIGEYNTLFETQLVNEIVTVTGRESPIILPPDLTHLTFELVAGSARAVLLLNVHSTEGPIESDVYFNKVLYEGILHDGVVTHETIELSGYPDTHVELFGDYGFLFGAWSTNNIVTVTAIDSVTLPADVNYVIIELIAGPARAVLVLNVHNTDTPPVVPTVTFSAESYAVQVDITQTGIIGQVVAIADNGERINYSLQLNNSHLEERLSINNEGELRLSSSVSGGFYAFQVVGTTVLTQAVGTATVYLSVETVTMCDSDLVMPPLIVIDRDEEEPHNNLIQTQHEGCHFEITNRWPLNQNWLYVNENGLHATAIDREHETIAFMPVSQIQVEITLICDTDSSRIKRSLTSNLGPYDYGLNKWILTDTILHNSRKSLVNLIVNDINDNSPIFEHKDSEPIAVGYPRPELQQFVLPRALTQLHATDADIGENAAIVYWSTSPELAVAPLTGFVHIRDEANLEHNARLTVNATDRNGEGHTGSIDLIVKLLDESNIAVVTVNDAFLDDEIDVVSNLSRAVGYDVKVLRSIVVPQDDLQDDEVVGTRTKREVTRASGASLQLYIYGIEQGESVSVDRLTTDINNSASETVNVANIISLEDHLASLEICTARDTGLLVATIVLAVLLFIVAALIALWFFLRWRKKNYERFSNENSSASPNESIDQSHKPEVLPRLNIEELKKSERRLQEMLETPIEEVKVEAAPAPAINTDLIDLSSKPNSPTINNPIVIQSIDKLKDAEESSDDEFGEIKLPRRKSVVTFNENVEKIIHVEDNEDSEDLESVSDAEVYKF